MGRNNNKMPVVVTKLDAPAGVVVVGDDLKGRVFYRKPLPHFGAVWYLPEHPDAAGGELVILPE